MDPYPIMQVGKRTPAIMNGGGKDLSVLLR